MKTSIAAGLLDALAEEMLGVFRTHVFERKTTARLDQITIDDAYAVQDRVIAARVGDGERVAGYKVGCTSGAVRSQFGLDEPIGGRLMSPHVHGDGVALPIDAFLDCAVEPEFVFHIARDLDDPDADERTLRAAIGGVSAGIEIHNYRFAHGDPTLQELIASNGIHAALVVSPPRDLPDDLDLAAEGVGLFLNGHLAASGIGAEIMGDPLTSLRWLIAHLARRRLHLEAGQIVIPGSAVPLIRVSAGDRVEARFTRLGTCRATFAGEER